MIKPKKPLSTGVLLSFFAAGLAAGSGPADAFGTSKPAPPVPPGYSTERTGDVHDFDYFAGG